jgi:hypothetical protein
LAGRPALSNLRKDGRSQRGALANNLAANTADRVKAVHERHNDELRANRQGPGMSTQNASKLKVSGAARPAKTDLG